MVQLKVLDTIQGSSFLAIQTAMGVFQRHNLDLKRCKIAVVREESSAVILFTETDGQQGAPKDLAVRQGSDVELSGGELCALRSETGRVKVLDTIQGTSFAPIQAAIAVFRRHNPDLTQYKIAVVREGNSVVIIFTDRDERPGAVGNPGVRLGFEVELNVREMRVVRSNFIR